VLRRTARINLEKIRRVARRGREPHRRQKGKERLTSIRPGEQPPLFFERKEKKKAFTGGGGVCRETSLSLKPKEGGRLSNHHSPFAQHPLLTAKREGGKKGFRQSPGRRVDTGGEKGPVSALPWRRWESARHFTCHFLKKESFGGGTGGGRRGS